MLSSLSSQSGSYAWFESGEDFDKTLLPWPEEPTTQPLPQQQPSSPRPTPHTQQMEQPTVVKHGWNDNYHTMRAVKLPPKPKGKDKSKRRALLSSLQLLLFCLCVCVRGVAIVP